MSYFMETEWEDWENLVSFGSKSNESLKKLQLADWTIVDDDGEMNVGGSDGWRHASSTKSSISASTDSSCKDRILAFTSSEGSSPAASAEALLGLKLGKRTYFENSSSSVIPIPNTTTTTMPKKTKSTAQSVPICCQVEGCNVDLSLAKEYHRKHRVCDSHSKCPKVIVGGRERRFCQQCSRFHSLSEFDEKKRSCRRRLSDHNARRRKPQQETIRFDSHRLSTPFYGGIPANSGWNSSNFTLLKGCCSLKSEDDGGIDEQPLHFAGTGTGTKSINTQNAANGLTIVSKKSTPSLASNPSSRGSLMISSLDKGSEYRRALSLLSSKSWDSSVQLHHQQLNDQPVFHAIPECIPFSSSDPTHHHVQTLSHASPKEKRNYSIAEQPLV